MEKKSLNMISYKINNMDIKKIFMNNGNEYNLIWDIDRIESEIYDMIDIKKGWVKIYRQYISEELTLGKLKDEKLDPKIKNKIIEL